MKNKMKTTEMEDFEILYKISGMKLLKREFGRQDNGILNGQYDIRGIFIR